MFRNKDLNIHTKNLKITKYNLENIEEVYECYKNFSEYIKNKTSENLNYLENVIIDEVIKDVNGVVLKYKQIDDKAS